MSRFLGIFLVLAVLCSGCAVAPNDDAEKHALAVKGLAEYQKFRADGQYELAELHAEKFLKKHGKSVEAKQLRMSLLDTQERAESQREQRRLAALWDYQTVAVDGGEQITAAIYSDSEVDPDAEVYPVPDARLVLRRHPQWGRSAYLLLNQTKLSCGPPCRIALRFDSGDSQVFTGKPADSGQGPALFIVEEARFLDALRNSKKLRVTLPKSAVLAQMFEFEVGGFDPARLDSTAP